MSLPDRISHFLHLVEETSDPRTMPWLFVPSPVPLAVLTVLYYAAVYFGPRIMASRPAFQLKNVLIVYNFLLVLLSAWMVKEFAATTIFNPGFRLTCQVIDYSDDPMAVRLADVIWWYYFSKIIEFLDTIFFILRKKNNQISFLHVYHHSTMPILWYIGVRYLAGGSSYFCAMVNSFIHVLMYAYYFLSAFGPRMQPYLWWKRYITTLQLIQFNLIMLHTAVTYYENCGFPRIYMVALVLYCLSHVILFSNFFYQSYIVKAKAKAKANGEISSKVKDRLYDKVNGNANGEINGYINGKTSDSSLSPNNNNRRKVLRKDE